ncbi:MAG: orotate phosphoribosyltransferase [Reyranella sp.]|uniref:orotate phosphoribosyltransferase n=1 Tax=Reyranella sp. TaxID=1929291 RepID=UPI003D09F136
MEEKFLRLLSARRGHFVLESGHHGNLWLDLDSLFLRPAALLPFVRELARRLAPHRVDAIVGPLVGGAFVAHAVAAELDVRFAFAERHADTRDVTYAVPSGVRPHLQNRTVAIVDDVVNAGSATRSTCAALSALGARPVAVGALLILGETALPAFAASRLAVECVARMPNELWQPTACPMCAAGVAINNPPASP